MVVYVPRRWFAVAFPALLVMLLLNAGRSHAASCSEDTTADGKRVYRTVRIAGEAPQIDGHLGDACWEEGCWSGNYLQHIPMEGAPPSQNTEIKVLYDDRNIYVAIRAYDTEPEKIDRRVGKRDAFAGDIVGICFDSYYDHRTGFEFDLTASGSKIDLLLQNDGWDTNWDAVWYGEVGLEDSAWTAEMRIPLNQLRYNNREEQIWGMHAWRWINRNQEESQWNLMPRDNPGLLYSIGEIHGVGGIDHKRKMELLPYSVARMHNYPSEPGNPFATGQQKDLAVGLDGKIGVSSNFTLGFTLNPDFGQVEADPSQLNLTAFEVFFEERRPFFLEGKNIMDFSFGDDLLFYSRRIGHRPLCEPALAANEYAEPIENTSIIGAVKLSGKTEGGLSIGILESLTARESARVASGTDSRTEAVEPLTNYFIARVQQDFNRGGTMIGGIFTATNRNLDSPALRLLNRNAYTGGVDLMHFWSDKTFFISAQAIFSQIYGSEDALNILQTTPAHYFQRPDAGYLEMDSSRVNMNGHGGHLKIGKGSNGNWRYSAALNWRSPGLDLNDVGFLLFADIIEQNLSASYVENTPRGLFRTYTLTANQANTWNFGGQYLGSNLSLSINTIFANKWQLQGGTMRQQGALDPRLLRGGPAVYTMGFWHNRYTFRTDASRKLALHAGTHFHLFDDGVSKTGDVFGGFTYRITNALQFGSQIEYLNRCDNLQYVDHLQVSDQDRWILATLDRKTLGLNFRIDLALSPEFTIQYYGNPYFSVGHYRDFKTINQLQARDYSQLYHVYRDGEISLDAVINCYHIQESGNQACAFDLVNPDFNYRQFQSNLVARWEYKPGSTVFLVWTKGLAAYENASDFSIQNGISRLFDAASENILLLKLNYWFMM
jgi:hypothetical protein